MKAPKISGTQVKRCLLTRHLGSINDGLQNEKARQNQVEFVFAWPDEKKITYTRPHYRIRFVDQYADPEMSSKSREADDALSTYDSHYHQSRYHADNKRAMRYQNEDMGQADNRHVSL